MVASTKILKKKAIYRFIFSHSLVLYRIFPVDLIIWFVLSALPHGKESLRYAHGSEALGQHRTIASADLSGSFAPFLQFQKREIHTVFPRFWNFELAQNLSLSFLAELCGVALGVRIDPSDCLSPVFDMDAALLIKNQFSRNRRKSSGSRSVMCAPSGHSKRLLAMLTTQPS